MLSPKELAQYILGLVKAGKSRQEIINAVLAEGFNEAVAERYYELVKNALAGES
ncbi:MAG: hypothetical protein AB7S78_01250 [Candidatus Omnitrophota bacterium]